ncbi:hypothetical protein GGR57DRAFT_502465 [Xylariaceae sp. FL1272]|nr:hypothetical protein GGR57DRAFT_502465 [Xylariaceae sp. FL1272]
MGNRDRSTLRSDSGYGDDIAVEPATARCPTDHPLTLKGYDVGPVSKLHVGDVFEFLWADVEQYQWEWKCLGYTRFIVLRHSESFPHRCVCIPISTGGMSKQDFAKPGIDSFQQGFVFANGEPNPGYEQPKGGPKLQYSAIGIELRPGKIRVKEDSRANYADIIEVDHEAQVMVIGDVVKYFDRVRRNVNKAFMRQILRKALEKYQAEKNNATPPNPTESLLSMDGEPGGADCRREYDPDLYTLNEGPTDDEAEVNDAHDPCEKPYQSQEASPVQESEPQPWRHPQEYATLQEVQPQAPERSPSSPGKRKGGTSLIPEKRESKSESKRERRPSSPEEKRTRAQNAALEKPLLVLDRRSSYEDNNRRASSKGPAEHGPDYDLRSMHNVAMAKLK